MNKYGLCACKLFTKFIHLTAFHRSNKCAQAYTSHRETSKFILFHRFALPSKCRPSKHHKTMNELTNLKLHLCLCEHTCNDGNFISSRCCVTVSFHKLNKAVSCAIHRWALFCYRKQMLTCDLQWSCWVFDNSHTAQAMPFAIVQLWAVVADFTWFIVKYLKRVMAKEKAKCMHKEVCLSRKEV